MSYKVKLELFEGPLDLLLYLVKKDHVNICDIPIAEVTEQYLQYLELMRLFDLNIAGEFLVMAATLIHIKSKILLPALSPNQEESQEEEDPRAELMKKLLEYQKFKEAANVLRQKELLRQNVFTRMPTSSDKENHEPYFEASLFDLISAFSKAMKEIPKELLYEVIKDEFTVEEKIHDLLHVLLNQPVISVHSLFVKARNKFEIVATFLAVLELIRLKEIVIVQKEIFGEIQVIRNQEKITVYERSL